MKRSSWIDKFLKDEKLAKIAKTVEAGYIEELRLLKDQVTAGTKWSSIDEALDDFAARNGFSRHEMRALRKSAGLLIAPTEEASPEALMEEGIGSQGAEFMAKSKKHKDSSGGPFIVTDKKTVDKIRSKEKSLHDTLSPDESTQTNEMKSLDAEWELFFKKYAQQFGKILDLPEVGSEEGMQKLVEELAPADTKATYNLVRHGFKFSNVHDENFTKEGEPVKVTIYKYSFLKTNIANAINQTLRQQLSQELPIDEWIAFLGSKTGPQARDLKMQLQKLQRDLFSDKPAYVETQLDRAKPQSINGILQHFPKSYQRVILSMLAEGEYRHLTGEAGRKHSEIFSSGHALGSFVLMESFDPYVKVVPQLRTTENKQALVAALQQEGKDVYTYQEFSDLLDRLGIEHQDMPIGKEFQTLKSGGKEIKIENNSNPSYKPVTNTLTAEQLADPEMVEEQLKAFQDRLASIIMQDSDRIEKARNDKKPVPNLTPLAYELQADGSYVPVDLKSIGTRDLTKSKLTYDDPATGEKVYVDNPTAGIHPSYKGSMEGLKTQDTFLGNKAPNRWKSKVERPVAPKKEESTPQEEKKEDRWQKYKSKADNLKKFQALTWAMIRLGAADLWIDDRGRIYPNQDEMEATLYKECLEEASEDVIETATDNLMSFVDQMPKESNNVVPLNQAPEKDQVEEEEFEQLPLAAKSIERLKKVAGLSEKLQKLLRG